MRQLVLDTETTGLEVEAGHRIIEIGCIELVNRRRTEVTWHHYLQPDREIDEGASDVHGIRNADLVGKPRFAELAPALLEFIDGAELIIHNAEFDVGFLEREFELAGIGEGIVRSRCAVTDTLALARSLHPGQRNSLDALCKRYEVDNSGRDLHGALLDAQLLADVYLAMTGGQAMLSLGDERRTTRPERVRRVRRNGGSLPVPVASEAENAAHERLLAKIEKASGQRPDWPLETD